MSNQQQVQVSQTDLDTMADQDTAIADALHKAIVSTAAVQAKVGKYHEELSVLVATYHAHRQGRVFKQSRLALP